jgi:hypothetical protein
MESEESGKENKSELKRAWTKGGNFGGCFNLHSFSSLLSEHFVVTTQEFLPN